MCCFFKNKVPNGAVASDSTRVQDTPRVNNGMNF